MITFRPAVIDDASQIAKVHVDTWKSTYQGIVPQAYLDSLSYDQRSKMWEKGLGAEEAGSHNIVAILNLKLTKLLKLNF